MAKNKTDGSSLLDRLQSGSATTDEAIQGIYEKLLNISDGEGIKISMSSLRDMADRLPGDNRSRYGRRGQNDERDDYPYNRTQGSRRNASGRGNNSNDPFNFESWGFNSNEFRRKSARSAGRFLDDLTDGLESAFLKSITGSESPFRGFRDELARSLNGFAKNLGVDVENLGREIGKRLGQRLGNALKDSPIGQRLIREWQGIGQRVANGLLRHLGYGDNDFNPDSLSRLVDDSRNSVQNASNDIVNPEDVKGETNIDVQNLAQEGMNMARTAQSASRALDGLSAATGGAGGAAAGTTELAVSSAGASSAMTGLTAGAGEAGAGMAAAGTAAGGAAAAFPLLTVALIGAAVYIDQIMDTFGPLVEGITVLGNALNSAANTAQSQNARNIELQRRRLEADIKSLISAPFDILKDAANKALSVWDSVLQTINATQNYTKSELQDLWSDYASRLRKEGLDSYISSADMMENLKKVLESGLQGNIAEEFSYIATVLNSAVPTQDFFQYADAYASLAYTAMKNGQSEEEAITTANEALENFASNVIYASRELSGGFGSGLKNASQLFEESVKIVETARSGSVDEISGVLTSVSAIVSSMAPDLASGVVDAVVKAAIGGNSNEITALRSMTSAGASNTAFLQALARNPQKLFSELFENLATLQNMSSDNYMEVAEALSSVFGISMDAFARVDFKYLANQIAEMNSSSNYLKQNIDLLKDGQTTLTADQLRMEQINKYMIDEGLSYVLDNEVGRAIQEHMWEEQLAREIETSTYGVELQGAAYTLINGIAQTVQAIKDSLVPGYNIFKAIDSIDLVADEAAALTSDVTRLLNELQVEPGRTSTAETDLRNLTTGNEDLHLIGSYLQLLGYSSSSFDRLKQRRSDLSDVANPLRLSLTDWLNQSMDTNGVSSSGGGIRDTGRSSGGIETGSLKEITGKGGAGGGASGAANATHRISTTNLLGGAKFYDWGSISKSEIEAPKSGTSRTGVSYSPIWGLDAVLTHLSEMRLQEFLNTIPEYTAKIASKTSTGGVTSESISGAREEAEYKYLTQSQLEDLIANSTESSDMSFENWIGTGMTSKYGILNLGQALSDYGLTLQDVRNNFDQYLAQSSEKIEAARKAHEVQFWENVEEYNNNYFPNHFENEFLRRDWMENWEVTYLTPIRDDLHQLLEDWEDYYIHHTAYTDATANAFESAIELADLEKDEMGDSVLALAQALTENNNWLQENQEILKDPVVHANVLLSQILLVTEAIMQQNNSVATTSAIPTTLLGLSTGGIGEYNY